MALHRLGAKVGILDADIYGPSVPKMLGKAERETSTTADGKRIAPAIYRGITVMSVAYFVEHALARGHDGAELKGAVDQAVVAGEGGRDTGALQGVGVGFAFVAQRVELAGLHQGGG